MPKNINAKVHTDEHEMRPIKHTIATYKHIITNHRVAHLKCFPYLCNQITGNYHRKMSHIFASKLYNKNIDNKDGLLVRKVRLYLMLLLDILTLTSVNI